MNETVSGLVGTPKKESQIALQLSILRKNMNILGEKIGFLEERIAPVLRSLEPIETSQYKEVSPSVVLALEISANKEIAEGIIRKVENIIERIEL